MFLISYLFPNKQAQPLSTVKAAYDYTASAPGELTVADGQLLEVYERQPDEDWILVQSTNPASHDATGNPILEVGYVPANYVEEVRAPENTTLTIQIANQNHHNLFSFPLQADGKDVSTSAAATATSGGGGTIVVPDSPPRPKFTTPEDMVAASKAKSAGSSSAATANGAGGGANAKNDPIETWSVSQVDKKGKKKKGTLGVGNGAVFFASEADKVRNYALSASCPPTTDHNTLFF